MAHKNRFLLLLLVIIALVLVLCRPARRSFSEGERKKILILTTTGWGNFQASKALEHYLQNDYQVKLCYALKDLLAPLDPLYHITSQRYQGEEFYNLFVPGKHFRLLGWIYSLGSWYIQGQKKRIHTIFSNYFTKMQPDLIISVIPIINNIVLDVAQELNIPFLLVPTDLDVTPYIIDITNPTYKKFYIGLPFDDEEIKKPLVDARIPNEQIFIVGAPLKTDFFTSAVAEAMADVSAEVLTKADKPTIMILMGSYGSDEITHYVTELLKVEMPIHIIACIGKNEKSKVQLEALSIPSHINLTIVGFTEHIADYMAVSDILISKSGTLSVCEALYMNVPLFLDATSALLPWEKFNHHFIKKHGFGVCIENFPDVAPLVTKMLQDNDWLQFYRENSAKLEKKDCSREVVELVEKIIK